MNPAYLVRQLKQGQQLGLAALCVGDGHQADALAGPKYLRSERRGSHVRVQRGTLLAVANPTCHAHFGSNTSAALLPAIGASPNLFSERGCQRLQLPHRADAAAAERKDHRHAGGDGRLKHLLH